MGVFSPGRVMMRTLQTLLLAVVLSLLVSPGARAAFIVSGSHTDHVLVPGASLDDVQMTVELSVAGGLATVNFTNTSVNSGMSSVFKEIVIDTHDDDDTGTAILSNPVILINTADVAFNLAPCNGLPGFHDVTCEPVPLVELQAEAPPPYEGLALNEMLVLQFDTTLADGSDVDDYLSAFGGGEDTDQYSIGFHAITSGTVDGESLSGIYVPEPVTLLLLCLGVVPVLRRRRST